MASPLSIASSLDSIWTATSSPTSPAAPEASTQKAELLPGWLRNDGELKAASTTTSSEAHLTSRVLLNAPTPTVAPGNALSPTLSDHREDTPMSPGPSTPSSGAYSEDDFDDTSGDNLAAACRKLRRRLRADYANTKPPGDLFQPFIQRLKKLNHCRLCPKVLENREQMNQHVMKDHCDHKPFACPAPGWYVRMVFLTRYRICGTHAGAPSTHRDARQADLEKHLEKHSNVRVPCPAW